MPLGRQSQDPTLPMLTSVMVLLLAPPNGTPEDVLLLPLEEEAGLACVVTPAASVGEEVKLLFGATPAGDAWARTENQDELAAAAPGTPKSFFTSGTCKAARRRAKRCAPA